MVLLQGFFLGAGLCASIGPQSLFVLRQGSRREAAYLVALICTITDFGLIWAAIAGAHIAVINLPDIESMTAWLAGGFVLAYGGFSLIEAWRRSGRTASSDAGWPAQTVVAASLAALGVSLLNPQTYAEMMVAVGLGSLHAPSGERWLFGVGVAAVSPLWFFGLAFGGRRLAPILDGRRARRNVDLTVALAMIGLGAAMLATNLVR